MAYTKTWLGLLLAFSGCSQGSVSKEPVPSEEPAPARAPLVAAPPKAVVAAAAPKADSECDCHGKHGPVQAEAVDVSKLDLARAPSRGPAGAAVTLTVFCDFECPYCHRVQGTLRELEKSYGASLRIVFKQRPLPMHENARLAAKASLAAHDQGRFWELHDLMMKSEKLDREKIERAAETVGLNMRLFGAALEDPAMEARVDRELEEADSVGARGTPTMLINGQKITGAQPLEEFEKLIDEALGAP